MVVWHRVNWDQSGQTAYVSVGGSRSQRWRSSLAGWLPAQTLLRLYIARVIESREYITFEMEIFNKSTPFAVFGNFCMSWILPDVFFGVKIVPQG